MTTAMARGLDITIGAVLVVLAVLGSLRWLDSSSESVVSAQSWGPFVLIGLGLLFVAALLLRRWWMLLPVGLITAFGASLAVPGWFASAEPGLEPQLTVVSVNLHEGQADPAQVMASVRAHDADVLVLTEVTPDALLDLEKESIAAWLPEYVGQPRPEGFTGTMIYSRLPLTEITGPEPIDDQTPSLQPDVAVDVGGTTVRLKAVRLLEPVGGDLERWREGLRGLRGWQDHTEPGTPLILAGTFNADTGNPGYRTAVEGLDDALLATGVGWPRTWPVVGDRMPPYTAPDHVLSRGLSVVEAGQTAIHGTAHTIVWASYAIPKGLTTGE